VVRAQVCRLPPDAIYITYIHPPAPISKPRAGKRGGGGTQRAVGCYSEEREKMCVQSSTNTMSAELIEMKICIFVLKRLIPGTMRFRVQGLTHWLSGSKGHRCLSAFCGVVL
jgi:hypothetical protein